MVKAVKNYFWFIKESQHFMKGHNPVKIFFQSLYKGVQFVYECYKWDKLTPKQREVWYLSGEGRIMEVK